MPQSKGQARKRRKQTGGSVKHPQKGNGAMHHSFIHFTHFMQFLCDFTMQKLFFICSYERTNSHQYQNLRFKELDYIGFCMISHSVVFDSLQPHGKEHQASLSMEFSRQEYWSGLSFPPPRDLPSPWLEPLSSASPASQTDSLLLSC